MKRLLTFAILLLPVLGRAASSDGGQNPVARQGIFAGIIVRCESAPTATASCLDDVQPYFAGEAHLEHVRTAVSHSVDSEMFETLLLLAGRRLSQRAEAARTQAEIADAYNDFVLHTIAVYTAAHIELDDPNRDAVMGTLRAIAAGGGEHPGYLRARAILRARSSAP